MRCRRIWHARWWVGARGEVEVEGVETVRWKVVRIVRRRFGGVTQWLERTYYIYQTRIWGSDEGAGTSPLY